MTSFLHKGVEHVVLAIPYSILKVATVLLSAGILVDFTLSFKAALDLRDVLAGLDKAKAEMERIQKRLDVIVAVAGDEYATRRKESSMRMDELMGSIEDKFSIIKEKMKINPSAFLDDVREELADLRNKYTVEKEHRMQFRRLKDFIREI